MEERMNQMAKAVFDDVDSRLKGISLNELRRMNGGKLRFIIFETKDLYDVDILDLELSVRASNGLKRGGFLNVGELVNSIDSSEDLKKIRNLGEKSIKEIMRALFVFQYTRISPEKRDVYVENFSNLNR